LIQTGEIPTHQGMVGGLDAQGRRMLHGNVVVAFRPIAAWPLTTALSILSARMSPPTRARVPGCTVLCCALLANTLLSPVTGQEPAQQPAAQSGSPPAQQPATQSGTPPAQEPAQAPEQQPGGHAAPDLEAGNTLELSIERAQEIALENNLGLRIEAVNAESVWYTHRATWGAFDWVVGARAGVRDAEFQPRDVFGGSSENTRELTFDVTRPFATTGGTFRGHFGSTNTKSNSAFQVQPLSTTDVLSLQYTQPLLRGAWREYATSHQRESELDAHREDEVLRQTRQTLLFDVSLAYWSLVAAQDTLSVAESSLELGRKQVDLNQRRLDAGAGTDFEVLQAQAEVARREELRLRADVNLRKAADDLKQLLRPGLDSVWWSTTIVTTTALPEPGTADAGLDWEVALAIAIDRRSELRQQRLRIEADEVVHERTRSERKAGLDLDLTASSQGFSGRSWNALDTTASFDFPTYEAALVFNYALGNRTARNTERAAWATVRAARLAYDDLESRILAEVRDAVRQVRYQAEAVHAADTSLGLARRQLEVEQARYDNQLSTTFQVLQFQQDLTAAMISARSARANYAKALATLASAQGLLGDVRTP
jgi:outer membrane protein TolC